MKNLKKVLALVLVVATLMGFATVSSAKFSDAESVKYKEAVDVMTMLNVINGYTDNTFRPAANVTRAQMAKMVAYIIAGGEDVGNLYMGANTFTDCTSHWARGYIAYASKTGFVAGVGNGKFNPEGSVTGTQAAKMLLCALGYDATFEGYTGANWAVNVLNRANEIDLLDGLSGVDMSAALSREAAAQMMFNALKATMVKYSQGGVTITDPNTGLIINTGASTAEEVKGTGDDYRVGEAENETMQLCEKYFSDLTLDDGSADAFGRPSNEWSYDDDTVTASKTASFTYTADTKASVIAKDMKNYTVNDEKVQNDNADGDTAKIVYENSDQSKNLTVEANKSPADAIAALTDDGRAVEIYTDKKAVTEIVVIDTYLAQVDKISANKDDKDLDDVKFKVYTNDSGVAMTLSEQDSFEFEEDDYVLVNIADGDIEVVTAAKSVEGVAKTQATGYYTIDGTKYTLAAQNNLKEVAGDYEGTYTFFLDPYGYVIGSTVVEAGEGNATYVYLKAIDVTLGNDFDDGAVKAKLNFLDGTTKTVNLEVKNSKLTSGAEKTWNVFSPKGDEWINIKKEDKAEITIGDMGGAGFYSYTVNSDGEYTLKSLGSYAHQVSYTTPTKAVAGAGVTPAYVANSSSKLVMIDNQKTYTGYRNFPTTDDITKIEDKPALVVHSKNSSTIKTLYVLSEASTKESVTYAYATSADAAYTNADGSFYEFYVDGEIKYYTVVNTSALKADTIFSLDIDDDEATVKEIKTGDVYDGSIKYTVATATIAEVSGEDYFKVESSNDIYYMVYDEDDVTCGVYDLGNDGKTAYLSEGDEVTIVSIKDGTETYALAVYIAE